MFLKRCKWLTILFLVSFMLIIKNSTSPYIGIPCFWWCFIFDKPTNELVMEVFDIIEVFAVAYSTSLVFYYIVSFRPAVQQEKVSLEIISKKLVNLYLYLSELIALIEFSAQRSEIKYNCDISKLDNINFLDETILCKKTTIIEGMNSGMCVASYNLVKTGNTYKSLILSTCNDVMNTPSFITCNKELKDIISKLLLSEALRIFPHQNDYLIEQRINVNWVGFGQGYQELCDIKSHIKPYVSKKIDSEFIDITTDDIEKWKNDEQTVFLENPEIAKFIYHMQKEN